MAPFWLRLPAKPSWAVVAVAHAKALFLKPAVAPFFRISSDPRG